MKIVKRVSGTVATLILASGIFLTTPASATTVAEIVQATSAANVFVLVEDDVATLSGTVESQSVKVSVQEAIQALDSINHVYNDLLVVSDSGI